MSWIVLIRLSVGRTSSRARNVIWEESVIYCLGYLMKMRQLHIW